MDDILIIRAASEDDVAAVVALHELSWNEVFRGDTAYPLDTADNIWREKISSKKTSILLGLFSGFICAFIAFENNGGLVEITDLYVDGGYRRNGIGSKLLVAALGTLNTSTVKEVQLWVDNTNAPAIKLYSRFGFTRLGQQKVKFRTGQGEPGVDSKDSKIILELYVKPILPDSMRLNTA